MLKRRTYTYTDPEATPATAAPVSGLEFLRGGLASGRELAPIAATLGYELVEVSHGRAVFAGAAQPWHYNPVGTVHGGVIATLLDSATGCAVHSTLPGGVGYAALDVSVRFVRAVTTGTVTATGSVLSSGRRTATAEATLTDDGGRLLAHAVSTCLIIPASG